MSFIFSTLAILSFLLLLSSSFLLTILLRFLLLPSSGDSSTSKWVDNAHDEECRFLAAGASDEQEEKEGGGGEDSVAAADGEEEEEEEHFSYGGEEQGRRQQQGDLDAFLPRQVFNGAGGVTSSPELRRREEKLHGDSSSASTSKSSVEWRRSSSETEHHLFSSSSSSRRSSSRWDSFAKFSKHDEEMIFLDKITAHEKLEETESMIRKMNAHPAGSITRRVTHKLSTAKVNGEQRRSSCRELEETESLRKMNAHPAGSITQRVAQLEETESLRKMNAHLAGSITQRVDHKLAKVNREQRRSSCRELERDYVGQVCLTWEALDCNYSSFVRRLAAGGGRCSAGAGHRLQLFEVLVRRFIENEQFERGKSRPEVFGMARISIPNLLQVPNLQENDEDGGGEGDGGGAAARLEISEAKLQSLLEDAIRTFMDFLRADRPKSLWSALMAAAAAARKSTLADVDLLKKASSQKKRMLKGLAKKERSGCWRRKTTMAEEEEAKEKKVLMGLIDMKVVSRVLKVRDISEEQLRWCRERIDRLKISKETKVFQRHHLC